MVMTRAAGFYPDASAGDGVIAAVVGDEDPITRRVAGVLSQHRYNVVHHPSATAFLAGLSSEPERLARHEPASSPPVLYILNCRGKQARGTGQRALISALKTMNDRSPRTAILVTVDKRAHKLIRMMISAGADEILSAGDAQIDELVWTRVQSAIAKAEAAPAAAHIAPAPAAPGVERRIAQRRRADRHGTAPVAWTSDVEEAWEEPASADEVQAARIRVRAALEQLPTVEERRGPLADVLGVSAPGLRAPSGRLDAKKIASQLGVSLAGLAKITPISRQALNETPDSAHAQAALDPLARILDVLDTVLPREHVTAWLNAPHARLEGETPIRAILEGRGEQVARMLERARSGGVD
jgi:DNA-binding NarL/FixJ family response regulator